MKPRFAVGLGALAVALAFVNASPSAQAPGALTGTYTGASQCIQGATNLKLTLLATPDGGVFGTVTVNLPAGTQKDAYTYSIQGTFSPATRKFVLTPVKWETAAPPNFGMLGFNGTFDSNELTGTLTGGGCTSFNVERARAATPVVAAASSSSAPAPAPSATAAPAPVAPPPAPPSVAPPAPAARTAAAKSPATPAPAKPTPPSVSSSKPSDADRQKEKQLFTRELHWHPDKERPQKVLKADIKFVNADDAIFAEAVCATNGVSVNFMLYDGTNDQKGPQFVHRDDPNTDSHAPVVDITVRTDGKSHLAKGFLALDGGGDKVFVNNVGLLFYDASIAAQVRGQRRLEVRTGTPLDVLTQPLALAGADAEIEEGLRTSAGPLSDLLNARSIEMDFPLLDSRTAKATFELSPQDPVMQDFVARCGGTSPSPAPAPAPQTPSRTRQADPGGQRPTR